ncbi:MAG: SAM-dependent methyltransferase [uncultured Acetobacteraceae bacterium]|uniref:SAM-dependent methyltransferase n=1 Tax=uncultured Acetobacteraceae bacterium TaxID=169975 RepID=A0A6J4IZ58_9PROT|nr:MAG: SAM-dependent methyltransferase [uncultured Acetobacteraceae bacterium]
MDDTKRRHAPATLRNRDAILAALKRHLPARGAVLEVASGTGEHAAHFAAALPRLAFRPSDPDPGARASIDAWAAEARLPNLRAALALDVSAPGWERAAGEADAVLCINMVHIAPWAATVGLMRGAAGLLPAGGVLCLYGPFRREGRHTAPSNAAFDADLRASDPAWGVRDLEAVAAEAAANGFAAPMVEEMPANNLFVAFRRGQGRAE